VAFRFSTISACQEAETSCTFNAHQFFQKNFQKDFKKVLTRKKNFAIITFVAPQGSNEAANAAGL